MTACVLWRHQPPILNWSDGSITFTTTYLNWNSIENDGIISYMVYQLECYVYRSEPRYSHKNRDYICAYLNECLNLWWEIEEEKKSSYFNSPFFAFEHLWMNVLQNDMESAHSEMYEMNAISLLIKLHSAWADWIVQLFVWWMQRWRWFEEWNRAYLMHLRMFAWNSFIHSKMKCRKHSNEREKIVTKCVNQIFYFTSMIAFDL